MTNLEKQRAVIRAMIESAGGQYAGVTFRKKDGTMRVMNVHPAKGKFHVKGESGDPIARRAAETRKENHPNLLPIWDVAAGAFRSVNLDTVTRVAVGSVVWTRESA